MKEDFKLNNLLDNRTHGHDEKMAISHENEQLATVYIKRAETLPIDEQAAWIELINSCKMATNGLPQQEKIQKMSENTLRMVGQMLYDRAQTIKVNQEFRSSNEEITRRVKEFAKRFEEMKTSQQSIESTLKAYDVSLKTLAESMKEISKRLHENDKDTYTIAGKVESSENKQGWLKTLLDGLDKLKWAIVTLGGLALVSSIFQPQIAKILDHIVSLFGH